MKLKFYTLFILLLCGMATFPQEQVNWAWWAKSAGGSIDDRGQSITTDVAGNTYITGSFTSPTITFGSTTLTNTGSSDILIVKYDPNGNVLWAKSAGGQSDDISRSITTDASGNIYITGYFCSSALVFGNITLVTGGRAIFIAKFDTNGNVLWAKSAGGSYDCGNSIATDISGNVYITGDFTDQITFGNITLNDSGDGDIFIAKYDSEGNVIWAKSAGGGCIEYSDCITIDASGNIYITGCYSSRTITFGNITLINPIGGSNIFIVKYDFEGNVLWAKNSEGTLNDYAIGIAIDIVGNAYITGYFYSSTIVFGNTTLTNAGGNNESPDIFIVKYDPNGNMLWAKSAGGGGWDFGNYIAKDITGNVYITGNFDSQVITFDSVALANAGTGSDIFIVKYDPSGNVLWVKSAGGDHNNDKSNSVATDTSGNIYITGSFASPEINIGSTTLINVGNNDIFIAKLGIIIASNNGPVCEGSMLTLTATTVPEASYTWTGPNGFTSNLQNLILSDSATVIMSGNYYVTATTNEGVSITDSTHVTVNPFPPLPLAGYNNPVCTGSLLSLTVNSIPNATYSWTGPNGFNSTLQNPTVSYQATPEMTGTYSVTATVNGCSSPIGTTEVIINSLPETPIAGSNGPVCLGSPLSLTANTIPNASYHWTGSYGFTSSEQNPVVSNNAQPWMSGLYYVIATDNNGCVSEAGLTNVSIVDIQPTSEICVISVDSITGHNVVVWDKPVTEAINHFNVYTEGTQAGVFELIGTVPYNSFSIYTDTLSNPAQQAYRYKISVVDTCGNESGLSTFHKSIHLSIGQGMGTTFNLAWSHYEGFTYPTYNIYRGTNPSIMTLLTVISSTLDSYTDLTPPAGYVYYQIEAVNPSPCSIFKQTNYNSARSNIVSNNTNAVPEYPNESEISIYPNPAGDELTITIPTYSAVNHTTLELFDIYGKLLKSVTVTGNTTTVDISGYSAGVYVVRFMDSKGIAAKRIVKR